ncbi:DUF2391 family protein [Natrinema ejinorense]|uniref:DUF2391 domain-containing protein n=1 Tax=Natrinema ejinorense TaxID=373386 RepID=A0A2A5QY17_9EURY|nr:DUF2391 family protein [Natrinema ejinorense]PCR91673.1 DUF2391 domain-containing protein [Natrinema ejinorense]
MKLRRPRRPRDFRLADSAQQIVGGFLLAGPFVVTEEVWVLAGNMHVLQALVIVAIVFAIGYAALYKADTTRDLDDEQEVAGVPVRFISLMVVTFGSVTVLALLFGAPETFLEGATTACNPVGLFRASGPVLENAATSCELVLTSFKAVTVGSVFSVVGAATADSIFAK